VAPNAVIFQNTARLDSEIIYDKDFDYDYFGFKTLERSYLLKLGGKVVERPQTYHCHQDIANEGFSGDTQGRH